MEKVQFVDIILIATLHRPYSRQRSPPTHDPAGVASRHPGAVHNGLAGHSAATRPPSPDVCLLAVPRVVVGSGNSKKVTGMNPSVPPVRAGCCGDGDPKDERHAEGFAFALVLRRKCGEHMEHIENLSLPPPSTEPWSPLGGSPNCHEH